jgi:hypothetical protein
LIISLEFKTGEKDRRCEFNELADGIRGWERLKAGFGTLEME